MKLNAEFRTLVDDQKFDDIEALWLEHLEEGVLRADLHLPLLERMLRQGHQKQAETLVRMLSEAFLERDPAAQYQMLHDVAEFWPDCAVVRESLIQNLRNRFPGKPNLQRILDHFNLQHAAEPVSTMESVILWLQYDVGSFVYMERRGIGKVCEINLGLGSIRVDIDGNRRPETFRIAEAQKLLDPLVPGHFLLHKLQDPDSLRELAKTDAGELLRQLFTSLKRPLTTPELKAHLSDIVESKRWSTWWKKARNDGRVTVGSGTRPTVTWSESESDAEEALWNTFEAARPEAQLNLLRKHADRSEELTQRFAESLAQSSRKLFRSNLPLAVEIALTMQHLAIETDAPRPDPLPHLQAEDAAELVAGIADRATREHALELIRQHVAAWQERYISMLTLETDLRLIGRIYDVMMETDPERLESIVRETSARPAARPRFFQWICREMQSRPELARRGDASFVRRLVDTLTDESFKGLHTNLREHFDVGGLVDAIVRKMDAQQAHQILRNLDREMGLEGHRKDSVRRLVLELHPNLEQGKKQIDILYVTSESLERKRSELEKIIREDIPENTEEIRTAAAHGDLRENFEYKSARDRQEMLSSRAKNLHDELLRARALDASQIDPSVIRVGTRVILEPEDGVGEPRALTVLGPWDSDPEQDILSYLAPTVEAMLGKSAGDTVQFAKRQWKVRDIDVWQEA